MSYRLSSCTWTVGKGGYSENFKSITFLLRSIPSNTLYKYNPQFYFPGILNIETRCVINYSPSVLVYFLLILYCLRLTAPHVLVHTFSLCQLCTRLNKSRSFTLLYNLIVLVPSWDERHKKWINFISKTKSFNLESFSFLSFIFIFKLPFFYLLSRG